MTVTAAGPTGEAPDSRQLPLDDAAIPDGDLAALIEALLLVAPEPATIEQLADGCGVSPERVAEVLPILEGDQTRGWVILRHQGRLQLATTPRFANQVRRFLGLEREAKLTGASLETLAIVAYRQPVTRAEIEAIRGVDCSGVLANLHGRGLIDAVGRLHAAGTPIQYGTTPDFLRHFGLRSLEDLPPLGAVGGIDGLELLEQAAASAEPPEDEPAVDPPTGNPPAS
ncbi:MAG: SMC-Scp complex subunit ScpB [Chloroflexota bacterium]